MCEDPVCGNAIWKEGMGSRNYPKSVQLEGENWIVPYACNNLDILFRCFRIEQTTHILEQRTIPSCTYTILFEYTTCIRNAVNVIGKTV